MVGQGGQCSSSDGGRSDYRCVGDIPGPQRSSFRRRRFSDQSDHAGAVSISQPKPAGMFNHSPDQHQRNCHRRRQVLDRHGALPGTIAGVLRLLKSIGGRSRCSTTRRPRRGLRANRPARRAIQISAGSDSLRIHAPRLIIPRLSAAAAGPVRRRSLDKRCSFCSNNFRKKCIHRNRCKLRLSVTNPCRTARILFAFPAPCCQ